MTDCSRPGGCPYPTDCAYWRKCVPDDPFGSEAKDQRERSEGQDPPPPGATAEVERLRAWKAEAMVVIGDWEKVWEALGSPGRLGESKAAAALDEARRLTGGGS